MADKPYPAALIQAYRVLQARSAHDKDLGLLRLHKEQGTELISVQSIVRGAIVIPAAASDNIQQSDEMLVWDLLDGDMFLRIRRDFPGYTSGR